jgi:hypothetical protein
VIVALAIFSVASFSQGVAAVAAPRSTNAMLVIMMILPPDEMFDPARHKLSHNVRGT